MKIFTDKQFDKYSANLIESNYKEGVEVGYEKGYAAGLIANKNGVIVFGGGIYRFDNETTAKHVIEGEEK